MQAERSNSDLVEDYLDGIMTSKEREEFEQRLESDDSLNEELVLAQNIRSSIKADSGLREKIIAVEDELKGEGLFDNKTNEMSKLSKNWIIGIAASLLLVAGAYWVLNTAQGDSMSDQEILANYEQVWERNLSNQKSSLESLGFADDKVGLKDSLGLALGLIEEGAYDSARKLLSSLTERYPDDAQATYYYGYNQLSLGNYAIALESFESIKDTDEESVKHDVRYYYALVLMKVAGEKYARPEFKKIAEDKTSPNREIARDYLSMMGE